MAAPPDPDDVQVDSAVPLDLALVAVEDLILDPAQDAGGTIIDHDGLALVDALHLVVARLLRERGDQLLLVDERSHGTLVSANLRSSRPNSSWIMK